MIPWGRLLSTGGAVFCYHSLATEDLPSWSPVNVTVSTFRRNVRSIRRMANIVPLRVLLARHAKGKSTRGLAALTFDDAYHAVGLLLADDPVFRNLPLTIFVATAFTDAGLEFWWDRLDDLHPVVPDEAWEQFERDVDLPRTFCEGHQGGGRLRPLRQWILAEFAGRLPRHVDEPLTRLERSFGRKTVHRAMTWTELTACAGPCIDIGIHTHSHPVLPLLSAREQRSEIETSHNRLRSHFENVLPVLAIPFGLLDSHTEEIARQAGMESVLTLGEILVRPGTRHGIPRLTANSGLNGWRVPVRMLGWADPVVRRRRGFTGEYPALPSATT